MSVSVVRSRFGELFSSKKKIAGFAITFVLVLAIPLTVTLLSQQQDIRQRASETAGLDGYTEVTQLPPNNTIEFNLTEGDTKWIGWVANGKLYKMKQITPRTETQDTDYYWETTTSPPTETPTTTITDNGVTWLTWLSTADNRSYKMKQIAPGTETAGADGYYETTTPPTGMVVHTVVDGGTVWYVWTDNGALYKMRVGDNPDATPTPTPGSEAYQYQFSQAPDETLEQFTARIEANARIPGRTELYQYQYSRSPDETIQQFAARMQANANLLAIATPTQIPPAPTATAETTGSCLQQFSSYCHMDQNTASVTCDFRNHCDQAIKWSECNIPSQNPAFMYNFCLRASTQ